MNLEKLFEQIIKDRQYKPTSLEKEMREILEEIKKEIPEVKIYEQYSLRIGFILDFAVFYKDKKIGIEVDGKHHLSYVRKQRDRYRDYLCKKAGWKIIRIPARLMQYRDFVKRMIEKAILSV